MAHQYQEVSTGKKRSCLGCLGRLALWGIILLTLVVGGGLLSLLIFPPFGNASVARVLLVGLDDEPREGGARRSDTIILTAARLNGSGATLLSVPRDARVTIPGAGYTKINAAYAFGGVPLLQQTLAQPGAMHDDLPYYVVFDSDTVSAVVDAFGGIEVDVPFRMKYDDDWGNLHIDLHPGKQILRGRDVVGYLRWRKNDGRGGPRGDDFSRTERQRDVLIALADKAKTWRGLLRLPAAYRALRAHIDTNLTVRQLAQLGWTLRAVRSATVPGYSYTSGGISYVECDWYSARLLWQQARLAQ